MDRPRSWEKIFMDKQAGGHRPGPLGRTQGLEDYQPTLLWVNRHSPSVGREETVLGMGLGAECLQWWLIGTVGLEKMTAIGAVQ